MIHPRIYWMSAKKINEAILYNSFEFAVVPFLSAEEEIQNKIVKRFKWILSTKVLSLDAGEKDIFFLRKFNFFDWLERIYFIYFWLKCTCSWSIPVIAFSFPFFITNGGKKKGKLTLTDLFLLTLHTDRSRQQTQFDYSRRYFQSTKCFTYLEKKRNKNDWNCEIYTFHLARDKRSEKYSKNVKYLHFIHLAKKENRNKIS